MPTYRYFAANRSALELRAQGSRSSFTDDVLDPLSTLPALISTLRGQPGSPSACVTQIADDLYELTQGAVLAVKGADGDPEMEWEDAVEQWKVAVPQLADPTLDELMASADALRELCGDMRGDEHIFVSVEG